MMPAIPEIPLPGTEAIALAIIFYMAGWLTPTYYASERLRGFGRAMVDRLPYKPPSGMTEEEAMEAAVLTVERVDEVVDEGDE